MHYVRSRLFRAVTITLFATVVTAAASMSTAQADSPDGDVVISDPAASTVHTFSVTVPPGGSLLAADAAAPGSPTEDDILVLDAQGVVVGAYDAPWALDAAGAPVDSVFEIEGTNLVQTVHVSDATAYPVTYGLIYSAVGPGSAAGDVNAAADFVSVPSNYVYDPSLGSLHDYCTASPDEFPAPFADNADFRGPCARHDLCYAGSGSEFDCDNDLWSDMRTNCAYEYSWYNPLRTSCYTTADIYWAAVIVA